MSYLRLESVQKRFGTVSVIQGVTLGTEKGEFVVFVDPLKRSLDRIRSDLDHEKITPADAEIHHGIVFVPGSLTTDEAAAALWRAQARTRP